MDPLPKAAITCCDDNCGVFQSMTTLLRKRSHLYSSELREGEKDLIAFLDSDVMFRDANLTQEPDNRADFDVPDNVDEVMKQEISSSGSFIMQQSLKSLKEMLLPSSSNASVLPYGEDSSPRLQMPVSSAEQSQNQKLKHKLPIELLQGEAHQSLSSSPSRHHVSLRFLLVDDSSTTRKMTNKLLTNRGYNCEEAKDGLDLLHKMGLSIPDAQSAMMYSASGLNKGQEWPVFDVILVDDNMPQLSGPESVTILRNAGYGGLIYGVTGNAFKSQLDNFMTSGADSVFTKPLDFNLLEETIRKALR